MSDLKKYEKILIIDKNEENISLLSSFLSQRYNVLTASNKIQALYLFKHFGADIDIVFLSFMSDKAESFKILSIINDHPFLRDIPVIAISDSDDTIKAAFSLGAVDSIAPPFIPSALLKRVHNVLTISKKQKKFSFMVSEKIYENEKNNDLMISILSHIIEFRNGESSNHVLRINIITEKLLCQTAKITDKYNLTPETISTITAASVLHDIGKIRIPDNILTKPERLTDKEFETVKSHTIEGVKLLDELVFFQNEPIIKTAKEICRWHHERYDEKGYPDGLVGDETPISAQVVAIADVYASLTSELVYKAPLPHSEAIDMICSNKCGCFNPILLKALRDISDILQTSIRTSFLTDNGKQKIRRLADFIFKFSDPAIPSRLADYIDREKITYKFFTSMTNEIYFDYSAGNSTLTFSSYAAKKLGVDEVISNPMENSSIINIIGEKSLKKLVSSIIETTPQNPIFQTNCKLLIDGEKHWYKIICHVFWSTDVTPKYLGVIGKITDITSEKLDLLKLRNMARRDSLTGLFNQKTAKEIINDSLSRKPNSNFAIAVLDIDHFKQINDIYGHITGNRILKQLAAKIQTNVRNNDMVSRFGGDEFIIFLEYKTDVEAVIERIFRSITGDYNGINISISMGIATTEVCRRDGEELFSFADKALYYVKRNGRGKFKFYDSSLANIFSDRIATDIES